MRFLTAGESHGPGLVAVVEGLPAGLRFSQEELAGELARRRLGLGRSRRMEVERDQLEVLGGVRFGRTLGSPVAVLVRNSEWERWQREMSIGPGASRNPRTAPRPGHADLPGMLKYDTHDARDVLERASARETAARTVAGYLAKALLAEAEVEVLSHVVAIGSVAVPEGPVPGPADLERIDRSPVRVAFAEVEAAMVAEIEAAAAEGDTLGGVFEVVAHGVPPGLGSHVHYDRRIDARLGEALLSIPGVKAAEIGDGFRASSRRGSQAHDEVRYEEGSFARPTGRAGGTEGGMTIGGLLRVRAAMKPLSTLMRPLTTVDVVSKEGTEAFRERSDVCAVPAAAVVGETMVAIVVAQELQRKFGGDTVADLVGALEAYRRRLEGF